ncbi:MAG: polyprenyl synthetase family protein [Anaerolineae bacterium]|nr:polyprenyl synthetase family protein [Anaerolineae bacterium]
MDNLNQLLSFSSLVQEDLSNVENRLRNSVKADFPALESALELIFKSGGKRIRPTMILLAGRMINAPHEKLVTLATAIEMLHTATLVHDDLIDNAILRRGSPTLNTHWSPGATVLTGDLVFACSARLAAEIDCIPAMKLFSQTLIDIVNGELNQMFESRYRPNREAYFRRIFAKTASMFQTGTVSASLITADDPQVKKAMSDYGYNVGIAFQIIDDILDFTGEQTTVGKPVASDLRQGLVTLPALIYLEEHPDQPDFTDLQHCENGQANEIINHLVEDIRASNAIQKAHAQACEYVENGLKSLDIFPDSPEKRAMQELASYIVERNF